MLVRLGILCRYTYVCAIELPTRLVFCSLNIILHPYPLHIFLPSAVLCFMFKCRHLNNKIDTYYNN